MTAYEMRISDWISDVCSSYLILPLVGLFLAPFYPAINSAMLSSLPKPDHAAMTGLLVVFSALGGTTGSFITGQVFAAFDGQTAFYLSIVPMGLLLVSLGFFARMRARRGGWPYSACLCWTPLPQPTPTRAQIGR